MRGAYYVTCKNCGANLDPGEKCDCTERREAQRQQSRARLQVQFVYNIEPPAGKAQAAR